MADCRNIVLVGFMGTGKTAVGKQVARRLRMRFVDLDREIEREAGMSIREIFASEGEAGFRRRECEAARALAGIGCQILSTGGGLVLDEANLDALSAKGTLVCLDANLDTVLERVGHDRRRPVLDGPDRRRRVRELMQARAPYYARIPLHVVTDGKTRDQVADDIIACVASARDGSRTRPDGSRAWDRPWTGS